MDKDTEQIIFDTTLKFLKTLPERFKRERIYQVIDGVLNTDNVEKLRVTLGDTDNNRDIKDS